jgi:hypothetical protein
MGWVEPDGIDSSCASATCSRCEGRRRVPIEAVTFEQAWAEKERAGYQYGEDALEQVRMGWDMAQAHGQQAFEHTEEQCDALRERLATAEARVAAWADVIREVSRTPRIRDYRSFAERLMALFDAIPEALRPDAE